MEIIFRLAQEQAVLAVVQAWVANLIKRNANGEKTVTRVIPWVTLLLSFLGYTVMPATAHAAGALSPIAPLAGQAASALLQSVLVTGTHSFWKNSASPVLKWFGLNLAKLLLAKVESK